jgi:type I restriction enzyme S subunit
MTGKLNANAMVKDGQYPFFTCDSEPYQINEYAFDTEAIIVSGNGSQVGHINYYNGKFNAYQRTYVLSDFKNLNVRFLLFYLKAYLREFIFIHSKKGSVPYITMPMFDNFKIPVPPLKEQERIVSILDKFNALVNDISVGLPVELKARRLQYEYYRGKLLTFNEYAK